MTIRPATIPAAVSPASSDAGRGGRRIGNAVRFLFAVGATVAFLAYLLFTPARRQPEDDAVASSPPETVEVVAPGVIRVRPGTSFDQKIHVVTPQHQTIHYAVMTVSGRVVASMRPGRGKGADFWQFDAPEVLATYTDWQKAQADIAFSEAQLARVKELAAARLDAQTKVVERLTKLVKAGTDSAKDLAAEKANLIQVQIQGRKEIYEAETAVRVARRAEAAAGRQLQQAGLDPDMLRTATADMDIVLADVPESKLNRVKVGQGCQAMFFGLPGQRFAGKVNSIAPVLSKERRSLRVLFIIDDPRDQLRPGMFAEIGLGTDPRQSLLVPADGILHIGRSDYVLIAAGENDWRVTEVQVGEPHNGDVEILGGLDAGTKIIGKGAILFKPLVIRALKQAAAPGEGRR